MELKIIVQNIVKEAQDLKNKHTDEKDAPVNYACIFAQSPDEYDQMLILAKALGRIIQETPTGLLFQIPPLETVAGPLQILKVRIPDKTRPERGDADFTVSDYESFRKKYLSKPGFKLMLKENFEMIELMDSGLNIRAYFSHPPLDEQFGMSKKK